MPKRIVDHPAAGPRWSWWWKAAWAGAVLFVGLSNYQRGAWEWIQLDAGPLDQSVAAGENYLSPGDSFSVAVVYCGGVTALVNSVGIETEFTGLQPPQNLAGEASPGQVLLTWDAVAGATGYLVERDIESGFATGVTLTAEPVTDAAYIDTTVLNNKMYYYRVRAVDAEAQYEPSGYLDVHAPQADIALPTNLRVSERGLDYLKFQWDWSGANPAGFDVFVNGTPDALLGISYFSGPGIMRSVIINGLSPSTTVYVRVAAYNASHWLGPATDDVAGTTEGWTEPLIIGAGSGPISVCNTADGLALAYKGSTGLGIARFDGTSWSTEIASTVETGTYVDIVAAPTGKLVAVIHESTADDFYSAFETEGGWETVRVHGDGNTLHDHPVSGINCGVAAGASEVLAWHLDVSGSAWRVYQADVANSSWSDAFTAPGELSDALSIAFDGEAAACLCYHGGKLQFGEEAGGWALSDALDSSGDGIGSCVQLFRHGAKWDAIALSTLADTWYYLTSAAEPWTTEEIGATAVLGFSYTQPVLLDDQPAYCTFHTSQGWKFNERKSDWLTQSIGNEMANGTSFGAFAMLDEVLYFIFADPADGNLKYMTGIVPE